MPTRSENPACLPVALDLVGKEHHPELAGHDVEASIRERQSQRIRLPPGDPALARLSRHGAIQHRLVEIGRHDARGRRKLRCDGSCEDAGSGRRLKDILRSNPGQPLGQVAGIRFEDEGYQEPIVDFRDRSRENLVGRRHGAAPVERQRQCSRRREMTPMTSVARAQQAPFFGLAKTSAAPISATFLGRAITVKLQGGTS